MTKTQEITDKMKSGLSATELIKQGYKRGLVYKVNKQLKAGIPIKSTKPGNIPPVNNINVDSDPDMVSLLKEAGLEEKTLKEKIAEMEETIKWLFESIIDLQTVINNPPISDLWAKHKCSCGAEDYFGIKVQCKICGKEYFTR